jgi:hypothetical protein
LIALMDSKLQLPSGRPPQLDNRSEKNAPRILLIHPTPFLSNRIDKGSAMPKIFLPQTTSTFTGIPSPGRALHALTKLVFTLDGPPDMRDYAKVVHSAVLALRTFITSEDIQDVGFWSELSDLEKIDDELQARSVRPRQISTYGYATRNPAWAYFATATSSPDNDIQIALGAELIIANILKRQFRASVIKDLKKAVTALDFNHEYKKIALRLKRQAQQLLAASQSRSNRELQIYVRILAALSSQLHPMRIEERQDAGTTAQLSDSEALLAASILRKNAEAGCIVSLQIIIAFCFGIVWDVALDIPFVHVAGEDWIAQLNLAIGITSIDLKPVLPAQAQAQVGHTPSAPVLVRSLPSFAHELLVVVASKCPNITCLRDLNQTKLTSHHQIRGAGNELAERLTIAKFIATRGRIGKVAGLDAATIAYCACDLTKIGKSKHSYITFDPQEIWQATEVMFKHLSWGAPVPASTPTGVGIGSCATPSKETAQAMDACLLRKYQNAKAGKKYNLDSLYRHHNGYAIFCAHRVAFLESGRLADEYGFLASDYRIGAAFGLLDDKSGNDFLGKSPIPIPVCVASQIELWVANLRIFDARLEKLGITPDTPVRKRIHDVLQGANVPLFFRIVDGHTVNIGSADVSDALPKELKLKLDDGRHFMQNALRRKGVQSPLVDGAVRHHTAGTALSSGMSNATQIEWLALAADAIDQVAIELGFFPIVGLGK